MRQDFLKRFVSSLVLASIVIFFIIKGSIFLNLFILFCFLVSLYEWHKMKKNNIHYVSGIFFLFLSFYSVFQLTNFGIDYSYFLFILLICISTDVGGYIFGKFFKGKKLTKISPNKTYSGMLGSFVLSLIFSYLFLELTTIFSYLKLNSINTLIFILLISLISQVGDIIISYFKRQSKIKNTGTIIPGHGGLLDRIDGMIFAFPFGYMILSLEILK